MNNVSTQKKTLLQYTSLNQQALGQFILKPLWVYVYMFICLFQSVEFCISLLYPSLSLNFNIQERIFSILVYLGKILNQAFLANYHKINNNLKTHKKRYNWYFSIFETLLLGDLIHTIYYSFIIMKVTENVGQYEKEENEEKSLSKSTLPSKQWLKYKKSKC